jgi:hypothetical protein
MVVPNSIRLARSGKNWISEQRRKGNRAVILKKSRFV